MGDCCNQLRTYYHWCQNCNRKRLQQDFGKWTSGNQRIDKFIQEVQLKARTDREVIEWIPYSRLRNIEYYTKGGFSTIYKAILLDGRIVEWNNRKQNWKRSFYYFNKNDYKIAKQKNIISPLNENEKQGIHVVLKRLDNSNINDDFLNEVS